MAMIHPPSCSSFSCMNNNTTELFCDEIDDFVATSSQQSEPSVMKRSSSLSGPRMGLRPIITSRKAVDACPLPPLSPARTKFLSDNIRYSATSSPRVGSSRMNKKFINPVPTSRDNLLVSRQESYLQRSKSLREGRLPFSPYDDFKAEEGKTVITKSCLGNRGEDFKCGSMCLYLPSFGKGKPVRTHRKEEGVEGRNVISHTVSLERFECGSWSSSAIHKDNDEDEDSVNLYFDLPMELIRTSVHNVHSPTRSGFVFDSKNNNYRKGILRSGSVKETRVAKLSNESCRVSTSNPTTPKSCVTPRLRKARDDFNAFLEAQNA